MYRTVKSGLEFGVDAAIFADDLIQMCVVALVELFQKLRLLGRWCVWQDQERAPRWTRLLPQVFAGRRRSARRTNGTFRVLRD